MSAQTIHAINLFHDCPREGFADFDGAPHHFECQFDETADEYSDAYCLTPISTETLFLVIERQKIFDRWNTAFHTGQTALDTHPALPSESARYSELDEAISKALKNSTTAPYQARATFFPNGTVEWHKLPAAG